MGMLSDGKQAVVDHISDGKQAIAARIVTGRDAISTRLHNGKDAIVSGVVAGSEAIANTRAGALVGQSVDSTLCATEHVVDYLLPPEKNEEGLLLAVKDEEVEKEDIPLVQMEHTHTKERESSSESDSDDEDEEGEKEEEEGEVCELAAVGRVGRIRLLSRKVKMRMYRRSLRHLHSVQQQCKSVLEQLELYIRMVRLYGVCVCCVLCAVCVTGVSLDNVVVCRWLFFEYSLVSGCCHVMVWFGK